MNPEAQPSAFQDATITEAVQLAEQAGPLDDAQAVRDAMALHADGPMRVAERARVLGQRLGLQDELARARMSAPWVGLGLVALVVLAGLALAGSVIGGGQRQINVVVALVSLLGLHLLTLLLWVVGLLLPMRAFPVSFGWLWLALTTRVAGGKRGQAPLLLRAVTRLLARARLMPWALGFVSHAIWTLSFAVVLAALLFALAFRNYTLNWETTILDPGFFVQAVQWLGRAPGWLGFPVPDAQAVLAPLAAAPGQRAWALWLTGCVLVYGLLPRLLLALLSAAVWQARKKKLRPDLSQPYFQRLLARFDALAPRHIVDADPGSAPHGNPGRLAPGETTDTLVAVGFELPEELRWPPPALEAAHAQVLRTDGSARSRRELLDRLARIRPRRLLVGCHAASTPDRGTERFLRELMSHCGECRLWLLGTSDEAARQRWLAWLADSGLGELASAAAPDAAPREWA